MAVPSATTLPVHRFDVESYDRMVASGALEGQRVELLEGVLVDVSPISPAHTVVVTRLMRHFAGAPQWWTQVQCPLTVPPSSELEPDLAVFATEPSPERHHTTALLVVEVAVSSQMIDRNVKAQLYAQANVPVYWLVDIPARNVEIRTEPGANGYGRCLTHGEQDKLPTPLAGVEDIDITALFAGIAS